MKKTTILLLLITSVAFAQQKKKRIKKDSIPKWKVHGRLNFVFNQASFSNWVAGGQDNIAGNININYDFNYNNGKWNWDNKIISNYGMSHFSDKGARKTNDRFEYNSLLGLKSEGCWFFSFFTNFITQYTKGYNYTEEPKIVVSNFFSPAYLSFGPGFLWKKSDDFRFNIAPATVRYTFVNDAFSGKFGVQEGENSAISFGLNFSSYYKFEVMDNISIENILAVYSDYLNQPENLDIEYQVNMSFKVNKFINMSVTFHTIIDSNASKKVQFREEFGLGVLYSFHKKVTY